MYVVFTATTFLLHVPTYFTILKVSGLAKKKYLMEVFTYILPESFIELDYLLNKERLYTVD